MNPIYPIVCLFCLSLQAFFSGSEMILLSANRVRLKKKARTGSEGATLALSMMQQPRWYLATTSTGTNASVVIASITAAIWFDQMLGPWAELATVLVMSPVLLMFGEILPRTIFQQRATELAPKFAHALWLLAKVISPLTMFLFSISRIFYPRSGSEHVEKLPMLSRDELKIALRVSGRDSDVKTREKRLINQIFQLAKTEVREAMVPLVDVVAVDLDTSVEEALALAGKTGHARIPVFSERVDNLIGIVHIFDLLAANPAQPLSELVRETPYVPELKRADELLIQLQKRAHAMAIVVDEYGGAAGIITVEDLLEEVVGEIEDEHDPKGRTIMRIGNRRFLVNARTEITSLKESLAVSLPEGDYETLGGFLLKQMGRIPKKGEHYTFQEIRFTVCQATPSSITELIVELPKKKTQPTEA